MMKKIIVVLLAAAMLTGQNGLPENVQPGNMIDSDEQEPEISYIDAQELDAGIDAILKNVRGKGQNVSVALKFTATGETYYYNADKWIYTASLCKLPVAMTFAHKLKTGELESGRMAFRDSWVLEKILVNSNYTWYSKVAKRLYGKVESSEQRTQDLKYAGFDENDLPKNFFSSQKYSARFFLGVIDELYNNSEEYPSVIDDMKKASPNKYLRGKLEKEYEVAQKYGSDQNVVHAAGIIYTDCPVLIVIMTSYQTDASGDKIIGRVSEYLASQAADWSEVYLEQASN